MHGMQSNPKKEPLRRSGLESFVVFAVASLALGIGVLVGSFVLGVLIVALVAVLSLIVFRSSAGAAEVLGVSEYGGDGANRRSVERDASWD
jgi:uncharacterized membrane protein